MILMAALGALCAAGIFGMLSEPGAAAPGWILLVASVLFVAAAIAGVLPHG